MEGRRKDLKRLTKIKLINWHYFANVTLELGGGTLLTGDNGSGKSTVLDAIQYVLVADLRQVKFNISAHDESKRDLMGYVRCKTGAQRDEGSQPYLRAGDVTSYAVLEFYDSGKQEYFLVGVVIDSFSDNQHLESRFFKVENCPLFDELFLDGNTPRNIKSLKRFLFSYKATVYPTVEKYREDLLAKMGALNERFFSLLIKALSFKPITDIRQFVYNYVLEERPVNVEVMRENLLRYKEYEQLVIETKKKLLSLAEIAERYEEILKDRRRAEVQDYIILKAGAEASREDIAANRKKHEKIKEQLEETNGRLGELSEQENELGKKERHLRDALAADSAFQLVERLKDEIESLKGEERRLQEKLARLFTALRQEGEQINAILNQAGGWLTPGEKEKLERLAKGLKELLKGKLPPAGFWPEQQELFAKISSRLSQELWQLENEEKEAREKAAKLEEELKTLKSGRFVYDKRVTDLQALIEREMKVKPDIFCELLEVRSEKWRNAVEGFLNTQRFDLILEPKHFDRALSIYERYKKEHDIHGVGLVNTARVLEYLNRCSPDSLAAEVEVENQYARGYLNQLMGSLTKCDTEQELRKHRQAITPTCMTYRNNTARQINFKVYEVPFIGSAARLRQVEIKEKELAELRLRLKELAQEKAEKTVWLNMLQSRPGIYARLEEHVAWIPEAEAVSGKIKAREKELSGIDTSGIDALKNALEAVEKQLFKLRDERGKLDRRAGSLEKEIETLEQEAGALEYAFNTAVNQLERFSSSYPQAAEEGEGRYPREAKRLNPRQIIENFTGSRKGLETTIANRQLQLVNLETAYNSTFHFGAAVTAEDISAYMEEKQRLEESELPSYEEKISTAMKQAEEEFKEHFIYKLKENIENARTEFNFLNEALKDVSFGRDRYRFLVTPAESHRDFYQMLMDTELVQGGVSLFEGQFWDRHREAMDELLDRLLHSSGELDAELTQYTDYRTYLDYDIKIYQNDEEYALLSQVAREKSGGETQTPYYVAILASFLQLYRVKTNPDSLRLVLFDEAFNRMDSDRIENILKFINQLGLQVIMGAPTEKCEYIAPHLPTTLLLLQDGTNSWVEDYHQLKLEWGMA